MNSLNSRSGQELGHRLETVKPVAPEDSLLDETPSANTSAARKNDRSVRNLRRRKRRPANRYRIDDSNIPAVPGNWISRLLSGWMFSLIIHCLLLIWWGSLITSAQIDGSLTLDVSFEDNAFENPISLEITPMEFADDFEDVSGGDPLDPTFAEKELVENLESEVKPILDLSVVESLLEDSLMESASDDSLFEPVNMGLIGLDGGNDGAGEGKGKGKGDKTSSNVKFFGLESSGNRFVFVLDSSGSMGDEQRYQRAVYELTRSLDMLETDHHFLVILYNTETIPMLGMNEQNIRLIPATRTNKNRVLSWLNEQMPQSQTMPMVAMKTSLQLKPSSIYFLSDGEFHDQTIPMLDNINIDDTSAGAKKIPINTITLGSTGFGAPMMKYIADESGGRFRWVQ